MEGRWRRGRHAESHEGVAPGFRTAALAQLPIITPFLPALRRVFESAGYSAEGLVRALGPTDLPAQVSPDMPYFLGLTRDRTPLHTLIRLFLLNVPVPAADAAAAFAPVPVERAADAGLVSAGPAGVSSCVRVLAFRGLLLACDHIDSSAREQVMGITNSTATLADFAVRRPGGAALDLGTGCGVLALAAAPYFQDVAATDVSERAVAFTRFNAAWNDIPNVAAAAGDAFDPVRGRRFDLILSNPPFVISPGVRFTYRDSGMALDGFAENLLRRAPAFLTEGGFFQATCDCVQPAGGDWRERITAWLEGSGCDAWIMTVETQSPLEYARTWVRDTEHGGAAEKSRLYEDWVAFLERERVGAVATLLVAMRKRTGKNWIRIEDAPESLGRFGADVALGFALHDYLEATTDTALLDEKLALHPETQLEQEFQASGGTWNTVAARIRIARGLRHVGNIDGRTAGLLARCDGSVPVRNLVARLAASAGVPPERVTPGCIALLRQLIGRGFLIPAALEPALRQ